MHAVRRAVKRLWATLHLPPKRILCDTNLQDALNNASSWRPTVIILAAGSYPGPDEPIMVESYVDIPRKTTKEKR